MDKERTDKYIAPVKFFQELLYRGYTVNSAGKLTAELIKNGN